MKSDVLRRVKEAHPGAQMQNLSCKGLVLRIEG
jgi:hypothetical protein